MQQEIKSEYELSETADKSTGIMPETLVDGVEFTLDTNTENGFAVNREERKAKNGGNFFQYTLHVLDENGEQKQIRYLFLKHLAPLARAYGKDYRTWAPGSRVVAKSKRTEDGFWEVTLQA